jgi:toxin ParE1/3/4
MSYILIFTNESQQDLREGFAWYEEKRVGLGIDFMLAIEATLRVIERNPFTYSQAPTIIPNIRRAVVFKFSYLIFYTVVQQSVIILSVVSSKQDAAIWKTRIGDV